MSIVVIFLALFLLIIPLGLLIWALVDLLRRPQAQWAATGQSQLVWALVVILVGLIGPILYLAMAKPRLDAATAGQA